jgi:hypothetical protein
MTLADGLVKVMYISIIFCCIYCCGWFVLFKGLSGYFLLPFSGCGRIFESAFGYHQLHGLLVFRNIRVDIVLKKFVHTSITSSVVK